MKHLLTLLTVLTLVACQQNKTKSDFTTLFETSKGTETDTYENVIQFYQNLASDYSQISLFEVGTTDSGKPLHLVVYNSEGKIKLDQLKTSSKNRVLVNNGIHPGESDGIDASMLLLRDIVQNDSLQKQFKNELICVIPVYNIGGALNRNSHTRANQNGPKEYGFRGNARNYDLNRDFVKLDTENAKAFTKIFHLVNPDLFIDNHVSNGADYQYAITHLLTQHNKLGGDLGVFLEQNFRKDLEASLAKKDIPITPYVNVWGSTPKRGFSQFYDSPRYSTGYTTLFNTLGLMVETHMLKPYKTRVDQTYELMVSSLEFLEKNGAELKQLRDKANKDILNKKHYDIAFRPDRNNPTILEFKGYEGSYIDSKVTNGKRLFYDKTKPYTEAVNYYNNFVATDSVHIPKAYILPQGWHKVVERLQLNNIEFSRFEKDTILKVQVQHIKSFETQKSPFEGHYLHYNTKVATSTENIGFKKGDLFIPSEQNGIRYLLETLEAPAKDSFFNWNFFDTILQQKEGFSSYVFEDIAEQFLKENPQVKAELDQKIAADEAFAKSSYAQLYFVYTKTPHYEKAHKRLPVFKVF